MPKDTLNEREFELVNIIGAKLGSNQRDLSNHMNLSLGMINMLIRRLISKGYIRINQLNKRKVEYILTPKGFSEKMRKSVKYVLKTIDSIGMIKNQLKEILLPIVQSGERDFVILGHSDFAILVEIVLKELCVDNYKISFVTDIPKEDLKGTFLICKEERIADSLGKNINLVEILANDYAAAKTTSIRNFSLASK